MTTTTPDRSTGAHAGTLGGTTPPSLVTSPWSMFGRCLSFDGVTSKVTCGVSNAGPAAVSGVGAAAVFTLEAKVQPSALGTEGVIAGRFDSFASAHNQPQLQIFTDGRLLFYITDDTGVVRTQFSSTHLVAGTSYDVALTYDGTTVRFFVNGTLDASSLALTGIAAADTTTQWAIGNDGTGTYPFAGLIDEVRWSNTCRHTSTYTVSSTPLAADGSTLGLWHLDLTSNLGSPLPTVRYLIAFQNKATDDLTAITQVATPAGTLGGANTWTDITAYLEGYGWRRGRQHELDHFQTGQATLGPLNNNDARFNPWNTAGPYYGFLVPRVPVQIQVSWADVTISRFTGYVTGWPTKWPDNLSAWAEVDAFDMLGLLATTDMAQGGYKKIVLGDGATSYWRLGDLSPTGTVSAAAGSALTAYSDATFGLKGALFSDTNTAAQPGGTAIGYLAGVALPSASNVVWTFECWASTATSAATPIFSSWNASTPAKTWLVSVGSQVTVTTGADNGTTYSFTSVLTGLNDSKFHHIVVVMDVTGTLNLYIDGAFDSSLLASGVTVTEIQLGGGRLGIAANPFSGTVDEVAFYDSVALSTAQISNHYAAGTQGWVSQTSGARVGAVLDSLNIPTAMRNVDTGSETLQANTSDLTQTKALSHLQTVEQTESGALFAPGSGLCTFVSRQDLYGTGSSYTTVQATIGDTPATEIPFDPDPSLALDDTDMWNTAVVTRNGGITQTAADSTSQDKYGKTTQTLSGQLHSTDQASAYHAQWLANRLATPISRLRTIKVNVAALLSATSQVTSVLGLELLSRVVVNRAGVPGGGSSFTQTALIEGMQETVTADSWEIVLELSPTDAVGMWVIGDPNLGVLDSTSRLGW